MRLTRRGRVLFLVVFLAMVFAVFTVFGGQSAATGEPGAPVPTRIVEVGDGDTLWAIASTVAGPGQVREMIHQIEQLNALPSAALVEGQEIAVPVSGPPLSDLTRVSSASKGTAGPRTPSRTPAS